MSKLLTVFGSTGAQGGALIDYVLKSPSLSSIYRLRGVTRDVSKASAIALKDKGVDMVQADMDDVNSLGKAVAGSYAVFSMTQFWEKASAAVEIAQGKAIADASVAAGAGLLIWSSLPDVTKMSEGKLTAVKHFDSKAEVEQYIRGLPITSTFYMPAFYMQNTQTIFPPHATSTGEIEFSLASDANAPVPLIDITDTGKYLAPILISPAKYHHKNFTAATAYYTPQQMVDTWTQVTGKSVKFAAKEPGTGGDNLTEEMVKMMKEADGLITEYHYYGPTGEDDLKWTLEQIEEPLTTWEEFVRKNEPWF